MKLSSVPLAWQMYNNGNFYIYWS